MGTFVSVPVLGYLADKYNLYSFCTLSSALVFTISLSLFMFIWPLAPFLLYSLAFGLNYTATYSNLSHSISDDNLVKTWKKRISRIFLIYRNFIPIGQRTWNTLLDTEYRICSYSNNSYGSKEWLLFIQLCNKNKEKKTLWKNSFNNYNSQSITLWLWMELLSFSLFSTFWRKELGRGHYQWKWGS